MNDDRHDDRIRDWLATGPDAIPDHVLRDVMQDLDTTPRSRRRIAGWLFDRGEGTGSGTRLRDRSTDPRERRLRTMLSITGAIAGITVLALAISTLTTEEAPAPAVGAPRTLSVAADGSEAYATIGAALADALDGDTIELHPGTYVEANVVTAAVDIVGVGEAADIVLQAPADGLVWDSGLPMVDAGFGLPADVHPFALALDGVAATANGFAVAGDGTSFVIDGGSPIVSDVRFDGALLEIYGRSGAVIRENVFAGGGLRVQDGAMRIEGNTIEGGEGIGLFGELDGSAVLDNEISGTDKQAIFVRQSPTVEISDNRISEPGAAGIVVTLLAGTPTDGRVAIERNAISGARNTGIDIVGEVHASVRSNTLDGPGIGISVGLNADVDAIADNTIDGGRAGHRHRRRRAGRDPERSLRRPHRHDDRQRHEPHVERQHPLRQRDRPRRRQRG